MADDIDIVSDIASGDLDSGVAPQPNAPAGAEPAQGRDAVQQNQIERPKQPEAKEPSVREQLTAAFKGKDGAVTDQDSAVTNNGQPRDEAGKFAAKDPNAPPADNGTAPEALQPLRAPAYFAAADAEQFQALPVEMQHMVARTMAPLEDAAARYIGYEGIEQVIGPRRQAWAINGMNEAQAVNQVFAISDFATRAPSDFIRWFAGTQGIDLEALLDEGGDEPEIDPTVRELREKVGTLEGQLSEFTQGRQAEHHSNVVNDIAAWGSELGTDGKTPLRPYFAELGSGLVPYIGQVRAEKPNASNREILADAYDRACWATPTIRAKMQAAENAARLSANAADNERRRQAGSSVSTEAPSSGSTAKRDIGSGSVRDTIKAAMAAVS